MKNNLKAEVDASSRYKSDFQWAFDVSFWYCSVDL